MKAVKILTMCVWVFLILYLPDAVEVERNIFFYLISFLVALAGIFLIEYLFDKKSGNKTNSH